MALEESDSDTLPALEAADRPTFYAPWQARAFAVAVALSEDGAYEWPTFQDRLAAEIERTEPADDVVEPEAAEDRYYRQWLAALERLLVTDGVLEADELTDRARAFADGDRDASEWVDGGHGHSRDHDHGHDH